MIITTQWTGPECNGEDCDEMQHRPGCALFKGDHHLWPAHDYQYCPACDGPDTQLGRLGMVRYTLTLHITGDDYAAVTLLDHVEDAIAEHLASGGKLTAGDPSSAQGSLAGEGSFAVTPEQTAVVKWTLQERHG